MRYKGLATTARILAWDSYANAPKTGDGANITLRGEGDGTEYTPSAPNITELDSTYRPGVYLVSLTASENNYEQNSVGGKSSTDGILIIDDKWTNYPVDFNSTQKASLNAATPAVTVSDKTGFSLSATGADLILKSSVFVQAIVAAINELATYGLTAINTLLVTTGIKTASTAAPVDMAKDSTVMKAAGYIAPDNASIAAILEDTGTTIPATLSTIDSVVDAIKLKTDTLVGPGTGIIPWTYTVTDAADGTPIEGVTVTITTDTAGETIVAESVTNASGIATFYLNAGAYYIWRVKTGYIFQNPDLEVIA